MSQAFGECRLNDLFSLMSEELSDVQTKSDSLRFARDRQLQRMRKRALFVNPDLQAEAVAKFIATNTQVGDTVISLDSQLLRDAKHFITVVLERLNTRFDSSNIQVTLDVNYLYDNWRFGPGASNGIRGSHAAEKIDQEMTTTLLAKPLVARLRRNNLYFALYDEHLRRLGTSEVRGSRLTTVPKNEDTERTIAIEPLGNMVLQLAAGRYLEDALRYIGLDITTQQPKNKLLALRGSKEDSLATIDLRSASDMISIDLVRSLLPSDWFDLLLCLRSDEIELPDRSFVKMNMMSTMGNGFTFPLMTLIISALIYGFRAQRGGPNLRIDWTDTAVFGDDIIIPSSEYEPDRKSVV